MRPNRNGARPQWAGQNNNRKKPAMPVFDGPQKLHKMLAQCGLGSRRELEEWIIAGRVSVNSLPAHVGQRVGPEDKVRVNGELINIRFAPRLPRVLLYHKPEGEIVSHTDPEGRPSVFDKLPRITGGRWIAVGRLDFNTSGLLLFTSSGELANKLMHPRYGIQREYAARLLGELTDENRKELLEGVTLEDGPAKFDTLEDGGGEGANHWYRVTLSEGRNREVRRMFEACGLTVSRLMRVRYGPVSLPKGLHRGQWKEMSADEVKGMLSKQAPGKPGGKPQGGTDRSEEAPGARRSPRRRPRRKRPAAAGAGNTGAE